MTLKKSQCLTRNGVHQINTLPVAPAKETVRKILRQTNSAAIRLLDRLIPLIGRQISAVPRLAEFPSDPSGINHLQDHIPPATGLNRRFLLFFRVEQGNRSLSSRIGL
jgi:hypothetical protein